MLYEIRKMGSLGGGVDGSGHGGQVHRNKGCGVLDQSLVADLQGLNWPIFMPVHIRLGCQHAGHLM